jgi:hypothetical protein
VEFHGVAGAQSVLVPAVVSCSAPLSGVTVTERSANVAGRLDFRQLRTLPLKFVAAALALVFLCLWLLNWWRHGRACIPVHCLHTVALASLALLALLRQRELAALNASDASPALTAARACAAIVCDSAFCLSLVLVAKGWCIVRDSLRVTELAFSAAVSVLPVALVVVIGELPQFSRTAQFLTVADLIALCLLAWELVRSINRASLHMLAHTLVIDTAELTMESTVIAPKHQLYTELQYTITAFLLGIIVRVVLAMLFDMAGWVDEFATDFLRTAMFGTLAFMLRLRRMEAGDYVTIEERDADFGFGEGQEIPPLISAQASRSRMSEAGSDLPEGIAIRVVTLQSPDGTTNDLVFTEEEIA